LYQQRAIGVLHGVTLALLNWSAVMVGVFGAPSRRIEATNTMAIRRYVEMGLGIGLIVGVAARARSSPGLHERSMSDHFGRVAINLVWRKGASAQGAVRTFANTIQTVLGQS
jgi:DNA-binding transcriptional LysR family regulator